MGRQYIIQTRRCLTVVVLSCWISVGWDEKVRLQRQEQKTPFFKNQRIDWDAGMYSRNWAKYLIRWSTKSKVGIAFWRYILNYSLETIDWWTPLWWLKDEWFNIIFKSVLSDSHHTQCNNPVWKEVESTARQAPDKNAAQKAQETWCASKWCTIFVGENNWTSFQAGGDEWEGQSAKEESYAGTVDITQEADNMF